MVSPKTLTPDAATGAAACTLAAASATPLINLSAASAGFPAARAMFCAASTTAGRCPVCSASERIFSSRSVIASSCDMTPVSPLMTLAARNPPAKLPAAPPITIERFCAVFDKLPICATSRRIGLDASESIAEPVRSVSRRSPASCFSVADMSGITAWSRLSSPVFSNSSAAFRRSRVSERSFASTLAMLTSA